MKKKNNVYCAYCHGCYWFGVLLWVLAFIFLLFAWGANSRGLVFGYDAGFWFVSSLVLGVLALPLKLKSGCGCSSNCATGVCK